MIFTYGGNRYKKENICVDGITDRPQTDDSGIYLVPEPYSLDRWGIVKYRVQYQGSTVYMVRSGTKGPQFTGFISSVRSICAPGEDEMLQPFIYTQP